MEELRCSVWPDPVAVLLTSGTTGMPKLVAKTVAAMLGELEGPVVGPPAAALDRWREAGLPQVICGDGASMYASMVPGTIVVLPHPALAGIVGRLAVVMAEAGAAVVPGGVLPLYVRRPDAEVLRDAAQLKR